MGPTVQGLNKHVVRLRLSRRWIQKGMRDKALRAKVWQSFVWLFYILDLNCERLRLVISFAVNEVRYCFLFLLARSIVLDLEEVDAQPERITSKEFRTLEWRGAKLVL